MMQWASFLSKLGDPYEQEAFIKRDFGQIFPRYSELWAKYIWPNRDPLDASKLRQGFPQEIEDIFNNHYYTLYQLNIVFKQISEFSNPDTSLEIADPFMHLGTAADLMERTLIAALRVKSGLTEKPIFVQLTKDDFEQLRSEFTWEKYLKRFGDFRKNFRPVDFKLHSVGELFKEYFPENQAKNRFLRVSQDIRTYRNIMAHSLKPLVLTDDQSNKFLPSLKSLSSYKDGRWSSGRSVLDVKDYIPAIKILDKFARELVESADHLWETLLTWMEEIAEHPLYKKDFHDVMKYFGSSESGESPLRKTYNDYWEPKRPLRGATPGTAEHPMPSSNDFSNDD